MEQGVLRWVRYNGKWMSAEERDRLRHPKETAAPAPAPAAAPIDPAPAPVPTVTLDPEVARAAEIVELCASNGLAHRAADFIRSGAAIEEVRAAADGIGQIETSFAAACQVNPDLPKSMRDGAIRGYTAGVITVEQARHLFLNALVDLQSPEIQAQLSNSPLSEGIAGNHGWDRAIAKAAGRI